MPTTLRVLPLLLSCLRREFYLPSSSGEFEWGRSSPCENYSTASATLDAIYRVGHRLYSRRSVVNCKISSDRSLFQRARDRIHSVPPVIRPEIVDDYIGTLPCPIEVRVDGLEAESRRSTRCYKG
jgi:hypothetical protein